MADMLDVFRVGFRVKIDVAGETNPKRQYAVIEEVPQGPAGTFRVKYDDGTSGRVRGNLLQEAEQLPIAMARPARSAGNATGSSGSAGLEKLGGHAEEPASDDAVVRSRQLGHFNPSCWVGLRVNVTEGKHRGLGKVTEVVKGWATVRLDKGGGIQTKEYDEVEVLGPGLYSLPRADGAPPLIRPGAKGKAPAPAPAAGASSSAAVPEGRRSAGGTAQSSASRPSSSAPAGVSAGAGAMSRPARAAAIAASEAIATGKPALAAVPAPAPAPAAQPGRRKPGWYYVTESSSEGDDEDGSSDEGSEGSGSGSGSEGAAGPDKKARQLIGQAVRIMSGAGEGEIGFVVPSGSAGSSGGAGESYIVRVGSVEYSKARSEFRVVNSQKLIMAALAATGGASSLESPPGSAKRPRATGVANRRVRRTGAGGAPSSAPSSVHGDEAGSSDDADAEEEAGPQPSAAATASAAGGAEDSAPAKKGAKAKRPVEHAVEGEAPLVPLHTDDAVVYTDASGRSWPDISVHPSFAWVHQRMLVTLNRSDAAGLAAVTVPADTAGASAEAAAGSSSSARVSPTAGVYRGLVLSQGHGFLKILATAVGQVSSHEGGHCPGSAMGGNDAVFTGSAVLLTRRKAEVRLDRSWPPMLSPALPPTVTVNLSEAGYGSGAAGQAVPQAGYSHLVVIETKKGNRRSKKTEDAAATGAAASVADAGAGKGGDSEGADEGEGMDGSGAEGSGTERLASGAAGNGDGSRGALSGPGPRAARRLEELMAEASKTAAMAGGQRKRPRPGALKDGPLSIRPRLKKDDGTEGDQMDSEAQGASGGEGEGRPSGAGDSASRGRGRSTSGAGITAGPAGTVEESVPGDDDSSRAEAMGGMEESPASGDAQQLPTREQLLMQAVPAIATGQQLGMAPSVQPQGGKRSRATGAAPAKRRKGAATGSTADLAAGLASVQSMPVDTAGLAPGMIAPHEAGQDSSARYYSASQAQGYGFPGQGHASVLAEGGMAVDAEDEGDAGSAYGQGQAGMAMDQQMGMGAGGVDEYYPEPMPTGIVTRGGRHHVPASAPEGKPPKDKARGRPKKKDLAPTEGGEGQGAEDAGGDAGDDDDDEEGDTDVARGAGAGRRGGRKGRAGKKARKGGPGRKDKEVRFEGEAGQAGQAASAEAGAPAVEGKEPGEGEEDGVPDGQRTGRSRKGRDGTYIPLPDRVALWVRYIKDKHATEKRANFSVFRGNLDLPAFGDPWVLRARERGWWRDDPALVEALRLMNSSALGKEVPTGAAADAAGDGPGRSSAGSGGPLASDPTPAPSPVHLTDPLGMEAHKAEAHSATGQAGGQGKAGPGQAGGSAAPRVRYFKLGARRLGKLQDLACGLAVSDSSSEDSEDDVLGPREDGVLPHEEGRQLAAELRVPPGHTSLVPQYPVPEHIVGQVTTDSAHPPEGYFGTWPVRPHGVHLVEGAKSAPFFNPTVWKFSDKRLERHAARGSRRRPPHYGMRALTAFLEREDATLLYSPSEASAGSYVKSRAEGGGGHSRPSSRAASPDPSATTLGATHGAPDSGGSSGSATGAVRRVEREKLRYDLPVGITPASALRITRTVRPPPDAGTLYDYIRCLHCGVAREGPEEHCWNEACPLCPLHPSWQAAKHAGLEPGAARLPGHTSASLEAVDGLAPSEAEAVRIHGGAAVFRAADDEPTTGSEHPGRSIAVPAPNPALFKDPLAVKHLARLHDRLMAQAKGQAGEDLDMDGGVGDGVLPATPVKHAAALPHLPVEELGAALSAVPPAVRSLTALHYDLVYNSSARRVFARSRSRSTERKERERPNAGPVSLAKDHYAMGRGVATAEETATVAAAVPGGEQVPIPSTATAVAAGLPAHWPSKVLEVVGKPLGIRARARREQEEEDEDDQGQEEGMVLPQAHADLLSGLPSVGRPWVKGSVRALFPAPPVVPARQLHRLVYGESEEDRAEAREAVTASGLIVTNLNGGKLGSDGWVYHEDEEDNGEGQARGQAGEGGRCTGTSPASSPATEQPDQQQAPADVDMAGGADQAPAETGASTADPPMQAVEQQDEQGQGEGQGSSPAGDEAGQADSAADAVQGLMMESMSAAGPEAGADGDAASAEPTPSEGQLQPEQEQDAAVAMAGSDEVVASAALDNPQGSSDSGEASSAVPDTDGNGIGMEGAPGQAGEGGEPQPHEPRRDRSMSQASGGAAAAGDGAAGAGQSTATDKDKGGDRAGGKGRKRERPEDEQPQAQAQGEVPKEGEQGPPKRKGPSLYQMIYGTGSYTYTAGGIAWYGPGYGATSRSKRDALEPEGPPVYWYDTDPNDEAQVRAARERGMAEREWADADPFLAPDTVSALDAGLFPGVEDGVAPDVVAELAQGPHGVRVHAVAGFHPLPPQWPRIVPASMDPRAGGLDGSTAGAYEIWSTQGATTGQAVPAVMPHDQVGAAQSSTAHATGAAGSSGGARLSAPSPPGHPGEAGEAQDGDGDMDVDGLDDLLPDCPEAAALAREAAFKLAATADATILSDFQFDAPVAYLGHTGRPKAVAHGDYGDDAALAVSLGTAPDPYVLTQTATVHQYMIDAEYVAASESGALPELPTVGHGMYVDPSALIHRPGYPITATSSAPSAGAAPYADPAAFRASSWHRGDEEDHPDLRASSLLMDMATSQLDPAAHRDMSRVTHAYVHAAMAREKERLEQLDKDKDTAPRTGQADSTTSTGLSAVAVGMVDSGDAKAAPVADDDSQAGATAGNVTAEEPKPGPVASSSQDPASGAADVAQAAQDEAEDEDQAADGDAEGGQEDGAAEPASAAEEAVPEGASVPAEAPAGQLSVDPSVGQQPQPQHTSGVQPEGEAQMDKAEAGAQ